MNRTQFWILTGGSIALAVFLLLQIVFARSSQYAQGRAMAAQQALTEGRAADVRLRQLAMRVYQVANQNQDQALKDILTRQQIIINPPTTNSPSDATAPSSGR